jgi:hypothetical protein
MLSALGAAQPGGTEIKWDTSAADDVNLLREKINMIKQNTN